MIFTIFFLNYYSYFLSVRFLRNPSRNIHGRDPHFTYHVILTLPLFGGLVGPLMDDNGITWVLYVHNDSIPYKQSAFSLKRTSVPVNSEMSWWPSEMPHCVNRGRRYGMKARSHRRILLAPLFLSVFLRPEISMDFLFSKWLNIAVSRANEVWRKKSQIAKVKFVTLPYTFCVWHVIEIG